MLYWGEIKLIFLPIYFLIALSVCSGLSERSVDLFINTSTKLILIILSGAVIGFFYVFIFDGNSLFYIINPDTRENGFYLTTFSNWRVGNIIRPAGIYDEPGALSLVICILAAIRELNGAPKKTTWIILLTGFITLSMAHAIYAILHFLNDCKKSILNVNYKYILLFFIFISIAIVTGVAEILNVYILGRFNYVDGQFSGDNRSILIANAWEYLNWEVFLFGLDNDCIAIPSNCALKLYNQFGDNPLGPLILGGITQFFGYYFVILFLFFYSLRLKSLIIFGVALLLLQRNEVMSYGYSILIMIFVYSVVRYRDQKNANFT